MSYPNMASYPPFTQAYPQPYQDRLAQLQSQYNQAIPMQMAPNLTMPQSNQGILWVQGEAGAKSYLVAPNTTLLLMDSESQKFYLKSTDSSGIPNMRTFEYKEISPGAIKEEMSILDEKFVTREEYSDLKKQYEEMLEKFNGFYSGFMNMGGVEKTKASSRSKGGTADE